METAIGVISVTEISLWRTSMAKQYAISQKKSSLYAFE